MRTKLITPPTDLPLTDIEARLHLRGAEVTEDAEILAFIRSAVDMVQHKTGRVLCTQTWEAYLDTFPSGYSSGIWWYPSRIELPHAPIQSITSVKYFDSNEAEQTLATSEYVVASGEQGVVRLATGKSWPSTYSRPEAVTIRYVAGYADVDDIPASILHWVKLYVETADKHRGMVTEKPLTVSPFADGLLDAHRVNLGV